MSDTIADKFSDQLLRSSQQPSASSGNSIDGEELEEGELDEEELDVVDDGVDDDEEDEEEMLDEEDEEWSTTDGHLDGNEELPDAGDASRLAELEGFEIEEGDEPAASSASVQ